MGAVGMATSHASDGSVIVIEKFKVCHVDSIAARLRAAAPRHGPGRARSTSPSDWKFFAALPWFDRPVL